MAQRLCEKCGRMMDEKEFYTTYRTDKYLDGRLNTCKKCLTMHVDNWDPETYKWILEECDVPYVKEKWDNLLEKWLENHDPKKITGLSILGKFLSSMKIKPWGDKRWADTEQLAENARQKKIASLKAQGYSADDIETELQTDRQPVKPKDLTVQAAVDTPEYYDPEQEKDEFSDQLTEEDKMMLRLKWGRGYRSEEWVRLEQLYNDFINSYDIQSAGHKDTLIMVCKASLKANQLFDAGDIEGAQKMVRVYNDLMKSGAFTAAQNKGESGEFIDSIGELVTLCEREGFIPRYYTGGPQDKVDKTLLDLQHYTKTLVTEEMNLGNMIESSLRQIVQDKEREAKIDIEDSDEEADEDAGLFEYQGDILTTDQDHEEYFEERENQRATDEKYLEALAGGK